MKRALLVVLAVLFAVVVVFAAAWYLVPRTAAGAAPILVGVDTCAKCAMAIKEPLHAAQFRTPSKSYKFDDIGCMVLYLNEHRELADPEVYVVNRADGEWIRGETAYFLLSTEKTPMGYGLLAYATGDDAQAGAAKYGGRIVSWNELRQMNLEHKPGPMGQMGSTGK